MKLINVNKMLRIIEVIFREILKLLNTYFVVIGAVHFITMIKLMNLKFTAKELESLNFKTVANIVNMYKIIHLYLFILSIVIYLLIKLHKFVTKNK